MATTLSQKLVEGDNKVTKSIENIDKTTAGLLSVVTKMSDMDAKEAKADKKDRKRKRAGEREDAQRERRKERKNLLLGRKKKKEEKKEKKGFMDWLLGGLGGILGGLGTALVGVLGLPALGVALGGLLVTGLVFALSNEKVRNAMLELGSKLWEGFKVGFLQPQLQQHNKARAGQAAANANWVRENITHRGLSKETQAAKTKQDEHATLMHGNDPTWGLTIADKLAGITLEDKEKLYKYHKLYGKLYEDLARTLESRDNMMMQITAAETRMEELKSLHQTPNTQKSIEKQQKIIDNLQKNIVQNQKNIERYQKRVTQAEMIEAKKNKKQLGGAIVPGSGSGDTFPAVLPEGSFVMNRNAMAGFQNGGIPAMLEPGEGVFGPGEWNAGHMLMNSAIPRFQSGGVAHSQGSYDTGPGWQPEGATDRDGRPVIFSKEAATAFAKMMKASYGHINTSRDMASSTRSVAKNNSVGGDQNSHHLHGEATDIHGGSQEWMKRNGGNYGWVHVNYPGDTHGGHFKYTGESTSLHNGQVGSSPGGGGGFGSGFGGGFMKGIIDSLGPVGDILKGIMSGVSDAFPDIMSSMFGGLQDILFGSGDSNESVDGGGGNYATASGPLSGSTAARAKEMFEYMTTTKGLSDAQAKGIIANIERESSFNPAAIGDNGNSFGLFQWNKQAGRAAPMKRALPNWANNWKGQIDYALTESVGPNYKSDTAGMSAQDAAFWWMNKWEVSADRARGGPNHRKMNGFINRYGFQNGGAVHMKGNPTNQRFQQAQEKFLKQMTEGSAPIIVSMGGGGGGTPSIVSDSPQGTPPTLPSGPSVIALIELQNRLNMGMVS